MVVAVNDKLKIHEVLLVSEAYSKCVRVFLFILYIPYNLVILGAILGLGLLGGIPLMLVFVWPAYFYNIRRFVRIMRYWGGKERYIAKV